MWCLLHGMARKKEDDFVFVHAHNSRIMSTRGICGQVLIDTQLTFRLILSQHSIDISVHLRRQSVKSGLTFAGTPSSVDQYMSRLSKCRMHVDQDVDQVLVYCQRSVNWDVDWVLIEMFIEGIDQHLIADAFVLVHMIHIFFCLDIFGLHFWWLSHM